MNSRQRPDSDFNSYKWNLWPWKHWMTIGIVCSEGKERPDHIVLCSDSLGSYGDVTSTVALDKLLTRHDARIYAATSHDIGKAAELMTKIANTVKEHGEGVYGKIYDSICFAVHEYKSARFRYEVLPLYDIAPAMGWKKEAKELGMLDALLTEVWPKFSIECQLIVGTFAEDGSARMFHVKDNGFVDPVSLPGFHTIGVGSANATFWLTYRAQHIAMGLRRSALHAYEAKMMAERSPHVGKNDIQMLIVPPEGKPFLLTPERPELPGCPVSLTEMKAMSEKYGPRKTDDLD
jgi:hypothetical protein